MPDDMVTMDQCLSVIRDFERLFVELALAVCTVSGAARLVWRELQEWRSPETSRSLKKTR